MGFRFRKKIGSKNVKANITQNGWTSTTYTTGGKHGELRVNYNSKRGLSMSIPGTGLSWYNSQYNKSRKPRLTAEEQRSVDFIEFICGMYLLALVPVTANFAGHFAGYLGLYLMGMALFGLFLFYILPLALCVSEMILGFLKFFLLDPEDTDYFKTERAKLFYENIENFLILSCFLFCTAWFYDMFAMAQNSIGGRVEGIPLLPILGITYQIFPGL